MITLNHVHVVGALLFPLGLVTVATRRNAVGVLMGVELILNGANVNFVAVTQLLIYIGGVLVLILFAVFLTSRISDVRISNTSFGQFGGVLLFLATAPVLLAVAALAPWPVRQLTPVASSTESIGDAFLTRWLLPFEVASLVLLATLIGAVVIARKEIKAD